jgi:cell wall-associated NlpC family hydrolase
MPFVGWLIFLIGTSAAYAAFKGEKLTDVIAHAVNPSAFTANPTLKGGGTSGITLPPGTQTEGYTPPGNASAGAAAAIAYAAAQLGKPYSWGGAGPNSFDCSGLTMQAYAAAGKHLPHFSQAQYVATSGGSLPIGSGGYNFPIGSLVFFGSSIATIDHVGIVVGPDSMIEAPHTGDVVKYYSISSEGNLVAATYTLGSVSGV